jgi:hypothetical protein
MASRTPTLIAALALFGVTAAAAQTTDVTGRIERIEPDQRVLVLNDGRMYRITPDTVVYVDRQPVTLAGLTPGQTVIIRSGESVALRNGQYVVVSPAPAATAPGAAGGSPVVITPPAAATPVGVRQTLYGRVDDVNDDGTVKIDTGTDSFKVKMSRDLVRSVREGDTVQLDMTVVPRGTPSASPIRR